MKIRKKNNPGFFSFQRIDGEPDSIWKGKSIIIFDVYNEEIERIVDIVSDKYRLIYSFETDTFGWISIEKIEHGEWVKP